MRQVRNKRDMIPKMTPVKISHPWYEACSSAYALIDVAVCLVSFLVFSTASIEDEFMENAEMVIPISPIWITMTTHHATFSAK